MEQKESIKKMLVGLIMILAGALLITLVASFFIKEKDSTEQTAEQKSVVSKMAINKEQVPSKFPYNLPFEEGAEVTENSLSKAQDGTEQVTRSFQSKQTLAANYNIYLNFLRNNDWEIKNQANETDYKMVLGQKGSQYLQVTMNEDKSSGLKQISITLTEI